jgi:hypothetical protein
MISGGVGGMCNLRWLLYSVLYYILYDMGVSYKNIPMITCLGFVIPLFTQIPFYFSICLTLTTLSSLVFWYDIDNNRNTIIHYVDSCLAKWSILSVIMYIIYKWGCDDGGNGLRVSFGHFYMGLDGVFTFFKYSGHLSNKKWGSFEHVVVHSIAHFFCVVCLCVVFMPTCRI